MGYSVDHKSFALRTESAAMSRGSEMRVTGAARGTPIAVARSVSEPPFVQQLASSLERRRASAPELRATMTSLSGTCSVRSRTDPRSASVTLAAGAASIRHGAAALADVSVVAARDGAPGSVSALSVAGEQDHPRLAAWFLDVLAPPLPSWRDAAEAFWRVLERRRGAPAGLRLVCTDARDELALGDACDDAYEIHGSAEGLALVLSGRVALFDAATKALVHVRGSYSELSVLTGASYAVAEQGAADDR